MRPPTTTYIKDVTMVWQIKKSPEQHSLKKKLKKKKRTVLTYLIAESAKKDIKNHKTVESTLANK